MYRRNEHVRIAWERGGSIRQMRENKPSPLGSIKKLQGLGYHLVGYRYSRVWKRVQISTDLHPFFCGERGKCTNPLYLVVSQMPI